MGNSFNTEEYIPKKTSLSPKTKVSLQNSCQEAIFGIKIKHFKKYFFVVSEIVFPKGRNNSYNFLGKSAETRLLGATGTHTDEQVVFQVNNVPLQIILSLASF